MNEERFQEIFDSIDSKWNGDNCFKGLQIISKYFDLDKTDIVKGVEHDEVFSVSVEEICKAGITEEDVTALAMLNWSISKEYGCLFCFV